MCVCVCGDGEFQGEDELDKELLWNLQLLSEVRQRLSTCFCSFGFILSVRAELLIFLTSGRDLNPTRTCRY